MIEPVLYNIIGAAVVHTASVSRELVGEILREKRLVDELDDIEGIFVEELGNALPDEVDDIEGGVADLSSRWGQTATNLAQIINERRTSGDVPSSAEHIVFEDERDAIECVVEALARTEGFDLESHPELADEINDAVRSAYSKAIDSFVDRVRGTELADDLLITADFNLLRRLQDAQARLRTLEGPKFYSVYDADNSEEARRYILDQSGSEPIDFVERSELRTYPRSKRVLLTGQSGSGKTRMMAELLSLIPADVAQIVIPEALQRSSNLDRLLEEDFGGDVLLVWDDIHDISPERDNVVFHDAVVELDHQLSSDGFELWVLATAQSEKRDQLPNSPSDPQDSLWGDFEEIELSELSADTLATVFERAMAMEYPDIDVSKETVEYFGQRAKSVYPYPIYVTSVVSQSVDEQTNEISIQDIETYPEDPIEIWEHAYFSLPSSEQAHFLLVLKTCLALGIPPIRSIVDRAYESVFDGILTDQQILGPLVSKGWITRVDMERDQAYGIHDIKIAAIEDPSRRRYIDVSNFLLDEPLDEIVPGGTRIESVLHGVVGEQLADLFPDSFNGQAMEHFLASISNHPEMAQGYAEKGAFLRSYGRFEEAKLRYEALVKSEPESPENHFSYAVALEDVGQMDAAKSHYETAVEARPDFSEAHYNYAILLENEGDISSAKSHYEAAIEGGPRDAKPYNRYAGLLSDEGEVELACEVYERGLEVEPHAGKIHYNYSQLLAENDKLREAKEHLEISTGIWLEKGHVNKIMHDAIALIRICDELGDSSSGIDACDRVLDYADGRLTDDFIAPIKHWKEILTTSGVTNCYRLGLIFVLRGDVPRSSEAFAKAWQETDDTANSKEHGLAAGVCFLGHVELGLEPRRPHPDTEAILDDVSSNREVLSPPVKLVADILRNDGKSTSSVQAPIDVNSPYEETDLETLEKAVFGLLSKELKE